MLQVVWPSTSWYVPGSQDVQLVDPNPAAYVPGAHMMQVLWPGRRWYSPGSQDVQLVDPGAPAEEPGSHGRQELEPGVALQHATSKHHNHVSGLWHGYSGDRLWCVAVMCCSSSLLLQHVSLHTNVTVSILLWTDYVRSVNSLRNCRTSLNNPFNAYSGLHVRTCRAYQLRVLQLNSILLQQHTGMMIAAVNIPWHIPGKLERTHMYDF
jgi:hypothetical protein